MRPGTSVRVEFYSSRIFGLLLLRQAISVSEIYVSNSISGRSFKMMEATIAVTAQFGVEKVHFFPFLHPLRLSSPKLE